MGSLSIWHWLIVLLVVAMIFGTGKLKDIGSDLGRAMKGFKEGMASAEPEPQKIESSAARTIEAEVPDKTGS